jgi:hypothetical protein
MAVIVSGIISERQNHAVSGGRKEHRTQGGADQRLERTRWGIWMNVAQISLIALRTEGEIPNCFIFFLSNDILIPDEN